MTTIAGALAAPLLMLAMTLPSLADSTTPAAPATPTTCKDGTASASTGKGACSGHGGVQKGMKAASPGTTGAMSKSAPAAQTPATAASPGTTGAMSKSAPAAGNTDPTGATAKCKDGTYSKSKSHTGACSKHGGVADWMSTAK